MKISTDRLLSFSAMFIGLATLFTVVYQTQLQRAAQSASVLPYLTIAMNASEGRTYVALRNSGLSVDKVIPGRLVSAGETVGMLGWDGATAADKAILEITYTSVYGDRWRVSSDRVVPERI